MWSMSCEQNVPRPDRVLLWAATPVLRTMLDEISDLPSLPDYPYNVRILTPLYGCTVDAKIFREACKNVVLRKFLAVFSRKFTVGLATLVRLIKTNCHRHHSVDRACDVRHVVLC